MVSYYGGLMFSLGAHLTMVAFSEVAMIGVLWHHQSPFRGLAALLLAPTMASHGGGGGAFMRPAKLLNIVGVIKEVWK